MDSFEFASRASGASTFPGGVWHALGDALLKVGRGVALSPILLFCGILLFTRSKAAVLGYLLPLPALVLGLWLGLRPASGLRIIPISCLALFAIPRALSRRLQLTALAALVLQLVITGAIALLLLPEVFTWWHCLRLPLH